MLFFSKIKLIYTLLVILFSGIGLFTLYQSSYKNDVVSFIKSFSFTSTETNSEINPNYVFGIDISHYQGEIHWGKLEKAYHPISYVFVRATMGGDGVDSRFLNNWETLKYLGRIRGAYHYYRPNENSTKQFKNFASVVTLEPGDFPPVLDIEELGRFGIDNLRTGVLNWLQLAEKHYGVRPIVYTGSSFYKDYLKGYVVDYPLWIAAYSGEHRLDGLDWSFYQFSEEIRIDGINHNVDGNYFNGTYLELEALCIK